ncbi:heavy metal-responsive transcriptional regulator [bacterium]|nr:heavy metal-responsive transcriptional regulator [bacterium]
MHIGELASLAAVSAKAIRYYEEIGVLPEPVRAPNGYREYDTNSVDRLRFVRDAQASGLSLVEISSILGLRDRGESTCDHVVELLERHLVNLDRQLVVLQRTREHLGALTARARDLDPAECTDPNRCQTIGESRPGEAGSAGAHVHPLSKSAPHT